MDLSPIKSSTLAKLEPIKPLNVSVPTLPDTPPRQERSPDGLSEPEAQARKASSLDRLKRLLSADQTGEQEYAEGGEVDDPFRSGKPLRTRTRRPATLEENQAMSRAVMQGLANMPYNILGLPGDIVNLLAAPTGRQPFYGSEQIKDLATRAGIRPAPPTDPTQAALYGAADIGSALINPAAVTRGAARGAEAIGKGLVETARDFQEYNRRLAVPGASYAVPPGGERSLKGALRPSEEPVRGQTSRELLRAQRQQLTDEQKDALEALKQQYPNFRDSVKFMTPQEVGKIITNPEGVRELDRLLDILPKAQELSSVAKAGEAKQGWYRASTQALIDVFGVDDAPRFAALLAAGSPQTSVEMNLLNTLNIWKNWTAAGRPTNERDILRVMGQSVAGTKGEGSILDAWKNNSISALTAPDPTKITLSGPKVDSFYRNLADDVYRVTNDAWMASGLGVDQGLFSGSPTALQIARGDPGLTPGYIGTSARMREAGQRVGMLPSEAQETTWSLFMPLYEMQAQTGLPAREILQRGLLTPQQVRGTPDFSTLLRDPKYGGILEQAGYGEQLSGLKPYQWGEARMDLTLPQQRDLERVAERLEGLREARGRESRARVFAMPDERPQSGFAYATPEYIPGAGIGHLEDLVTAPLGTRKHFSSRAAGAFKDIQGRDVLQGALGLNPIETRSMTGAFRPSGEVPYAGGYLGGLSTTGRMPMEIQPGFASGVEVPITKDLNIPQRVQNQLTAAEAVRGAMTAQHGSPWNMQIPTERGKSLFVPLEKKADPERMGLSAALQGSDTAIADTGTGAAVLNFGARLSREEAKAIAQRLGGEESIPTKNISDYVDYSKEWLRPPGSGAVTRKMLENVERLPAGQQMALSEATRQPAEELYRLYQSAGNKPGRTTRSDLMRLLEILRDKGLPGAAAALAAGEALPAEESRKSGGLAALRRE